VSSAACAIYSLNFSASPCQICLLLRLLLVAISHPDSAGDIPRLPDLWLFLVYRSPEKLRSSSRSILKMVPSCSTQRYREWCSGFLLQCQPATREESLSHQICSLNLSLGRPAGFSCDFCHKDCMAYLVVNSFSSPSLMEPGSEMWIVSFFFSLCCFSVSLCLLAVCHLSLIPNALPFLEYSLSLVTLTHSQIHMELTNPPSYPKNIWVFKLYLNNH
jgi:hypothetical protein